MTQRILTTRDETYTGYDTRTALQSGTGNFLSLDQCDDNTLGLLERLYDVVPAGAVIPYISATAPTGWLYCNGSKISLAGTADYTGVAFRTLFITLWDNARLSDSGSTCLAYNSNGSTLYTGGSAVAGVLAGCSTTGASAWTSNLVLTIPDMRGSFIVGSYAGSSSSFKPKLVGAGGSNIVDASHTHTVTFTGNTIDLAHTHTYTSTSTSLAHTHTISGDTQGTVAVIPQNSIGHSHSITIGAVQVKASDAPTTDPWVMHDPTRAGASPTRTALDIHLANADETAGITTTTSPEANAITNPSNTLDTTTSHSHHINTITSSSALSTVTIAGTTATESPSLASVAITGSNVCSTAGSTTLAIIPPYYALHFIIKYSYGLAI